MRWFGCGGTNSSSDVEDQPVPSFAPFTVSFEVLSAFGFCFKHNGCCFVVDIVEFFLEVLCPVLLASR